MIKTQDYGNANALLSTVPVNTKCYDSVKNTLIQAHVANKEDMAEQQLQMAKGAIAEQNYSEALNVLTHVDPNTKEFRESRQLIDKIEKNQINVTKGSAFQGFKWAMIIILIIFVVIIWLYCFLGHYGI